MSDSESDLSIVERVLRYTPSTPLAVGAGGLFGAVCVLLFLRVLRTRHWWGLCLPIGAQCYAMGFLARILVKNDPDSIFKFASMQLLLVCSPAAFLAFNYIVYGRLVVEKIGAKYSPIKPTIVARIFVISDVVTFLVQAGGGGMQSNSSTTSLGETVLLVGLIIQSLSYVVFVGLFVFTHLKVNRRQEHAKTAPWWKVVWLLYISSFFIVIRSIYRLIELAQGDGGYLKTHEVYLYVLDTVPLFLAIVVYVPYWPGTYIYATSPSTTFEQYPLNNQRV